MGLTSLMPADGAVPEGESEEPEVAFEVETVPVDCGDAAGVFEAASASLEAPIGAPLGAELLEAADFESLVAPIEDSVVGFVGV